MDGGGRLLGSLTRSVLAGLVPAVPQLAGWPSASRALPGAGPLTRRERRTRLRSGVWYGLARRGALGFTLIAAVLGGTGLYGAVRNGDYASFVTEYGTPWDIAARVAGLPVRAVTITGLKVMEPPEVLQAAGIDPRRSLLFLSAGEVRSRLVELPLIRDAVVTRLFPNRLAIALDERDPVAIWQKDGQLSIVSSDGVAIDAVRDDRFSSLPFIVGAGANGRLAEYLAIIDRAGDLRPRIVAGVRVGERRWDLKMDNGVMVSLPEIDPGAAVARLAELDRTQRVLDKDLISIDLRIPGRVTVRLSEDAAATRAAALAKKPKKGSAP